MPQWFYDYLIKNHNTTMDYYLISKNYKIIVMKLQEKFTKYFFLRNKTLNET